MDATEVKLQELAQSLEEVRQQDPETYAKMEKELTQQLEAILTLLNRA